MSILERPWCWEGLGAGGEGDDRGWDGWMTSPGRWTWVWVNSGSWWWTGMPAVLQFMGSQTVGHDWSNFTHMHAQGSHMHCPSQNILGMTVRSICEVSEFGQVIWDACMWYEHTYIIHIIYLNNVKLKSYVTYSYVPGGTWPLRYSYFRRTVLWTC